MDTDMVDEGVDADEHGSDTDLENLKASVKQLSSEVGHLQSELNAAKLLEFETSEQNANLIQELDNEREKSSKLEAEVAELKKQNEQLLRVSNMMRRELQELKELEQNQRNSVATLRYRPPFSFKFVFDSCFSGKRRTITRRRGTYLSTKVFFCSKASTQTKTRTT